MTGKARYRTVKRPPFRGSRTLGEIRQAVAAVKSGQETETMATTKRKSKSKSTAYVIHIGLDVLATGNKADVLAGLIRDEVEKLLDSHKLTAESSIALWPLRDAVDKAKAHKMITGEWVAKIKETPPKRGTIYAFGETKKEALANLRKFFHSLGD